MQQQQLLCCRPAGLQVGILADISRTASLCSLGRILPDGRSAWQCPQVDFLPDGHYQQDSITLEDQQRRMELFNAAVDSYIAGKGGVECVVGGHAAA